MTSALPPFPDNRPAPGSCSAAPELHIASMVVHAAPRRLAEVRGAILAIDGGEIHGASETGKLVVTLEAPSTEDMLARIAQIQRLDGVLASALVYQHSDTLAAMNEEIDDVHGS